MLCTWTEITQALSQYKVRSLDEHAVSFDWPSDGPAAAIFQVVCAELGGRPRVLIGVNVLPETQVQATAALRMNSELSIGALSAFKGNIVLKQTLSVGRFDADELHEVIAAMARTVEQAQERLSKSGPRVLQSYAD